jgi:uncharacterized Zn finger protein
MWYRDFYPKSKPKAVAGGIKAQSKSGAFGQTWWAKRWIAVLEGFDIGSRLQRGRSYARKGQVTDIAVKPGRVTAKVQGSAPKPYAVSIAIPLIPDRDWQKLVAELNTRAVFAAKLHAGQMPPDIESAFAAAGLSLFPKALKEIDTDCSCPDWSNPCKHIAAVYYLLGEEFDRDPFLLFRLRGMERDTLRERLAQVPTAPTPKAEPAEPAAPPDPLPSDPAAFCASASLPAGWLGDVRTPPVSGALPKRLGGFPFWRGESRFLDAVTPTYPAAARRGLSLLETELGKPVEVTG